MKKTDLLLGMGIGFLATLAGSYLFIEFFTNYVFLDGIRIMKMNGHLGKVITLGAVVNLIVFFILLHYKKELMARGVILSLITLTILTLFV